MNTARANPIIVSLLLAGVLCVPAARPIDPGI